MYIIIYIQSQSSLLTIKSQGDGLHSKVYGYINQMSVKQASKWNILYKQGT